MRTSIHHDASTLTISVDGTARVDIEVWSTTATVIVTEARMSERALDELNDELAEIDAACSRFRPDSEINRLLARPGTETELLGVLNAVITEALRVARAV